MDYTAAITNRGPRVHRATCTKAKKSALVPLADLTETQLREAKPGSCCRPKPTAVAEALAAALEPTPDPVPVTVAYSDAKTVAGHFFRHAAVLPAAAIADAAGVTKAHSPTARTVTFTGPHDRAQAAASALTAVLQEAPDALARFKAEDATWKGMAKTGPGSHQGAYARLRQFLQQWGEARGVEVVEARP